MPTYNFLNKENGELLELEMSMSEREPWLEEHPEYQQVFTPNSFPAMCDAVRLGVSRPSKQHEANLKRMRTNIHRNTLDSGRFGHNITEI